MMDAGKQYLSTVTVRNEHIDMFGHVNNAAYLQMLEEVRWKWISDGGFTRETIEETNQGPVILEIKLRFSKELLVDQTVKVESVCASYRGRIGMIEQCMKSENDEVHCSAEFKFGLFDLKSRKLVSPTPKWLKALGY